jgi:carbonic anhydrase
MSAEVSSSESPAAPERGSWQQDLTAGLVVFLVALPLCLGIALASGKDVPLMAGLLGGIIGGIVVGSLSGSHTSVSGPAAGLTAVVAAQIATLGSFDAFLLAVFFAGLIQIALGALRAGAISAFVPSSVIKGLLAAIGVILILKQIPHIFRHDTDPEGDMSFDQPDSKNTFTELATIFEGEIHLGAMVVGFASIALLVLWDRYKPLKNSFLPGPLAVVLVGVGFTFLLRAVGGDWLIGPSHLVQIPVAESLSELTSFLRMADFSQWQNSQVYIAAFTIAIVASLETLLNAEAVDKLDPQQRKTPPSRELVAQGVGNTLAGLVGALPITSVIVRGSVNVAAGSRTKVSAIFHGVLLMVAVVFLPTYLNTIPLAALAAILLVTGFKLVARNSSSRCGRKAATSLHRLSSRFWRSSLQTC